MTKLAQATFVRDLANGIAGDIVARISRDKIPPEWDGHELRCLFSEKARSYAAQTEIRLHPRGKRARDYRNTVVVNNL